MSSIEEVLSNIKVNDLFFINIMKNINLKEEIELYISNKTISFSEDYPYESSAQLEYINDDTEIKNLEFERINESGGIINIEISNTIEYTKIYKNPMYDSSIDDSNEEFLYNPNNEAKITIQLEAYVDFYSEEINNINDDLEVTKLEIINIYFEEI